MPNKHSGKTAYWAVFQYKDRISRYEEFLYKDKMAMRPSYIHNGDAHLSKTASSFWDGPLQA